PLPPVAPTASPWYADGWGDALAVTGVLGVGAGVTFALLANHETQSANSATTLSTYRDDAAAAGRFRTVGSVSLAAGGCLVVAAVIGWATLPRHARGTRSVESAVPIGSF